MDHQLKTIHVYNQYVDAYVTKFMSFDLYDDTFNDLLALLPKESNLLELGCGPGNVIHYFLTKRPDLKILGVDLAPEMLKRAASINPQARFLEMDVRQLSKLDGKFDVVVAAFCLPYLSYSDLDNFFLGLKLLTNDEGLVYLSCMEGLQSQSGYEKTSFTGNSELYIYYHQRQNLEEQLSSNGFVVEKFYTKDYPEADGSVTTDLIYIARKQ